MFASKEERRAKKKSKRWERWHAACDDLGIPHDVRERLIKIEDPDNPKPPHWYVGSQDPTVMGEPR